MREAKRALGVSRQTVLQRVKRGEIEAIHVMRGTQKGLRLKVMARNPNSSIKLHKLGCSMQHDPRSPGYPHRAPSSPVYP